MHKTAIPMLAAAALLGMATTASAQELSEPQARAALLAACSNVSSLSRDRGGNWHGLCSNGPMVVDTAGKVSADKSGASKELSEGQARAIMMTVCDNVSTLQEDRQGAWHGMCSKGAVTIDPKGQVIANK